MTCPCFGCVERSVGCHGRCKRYSLWRQLRDAQAALRRRESDVDIYVAGSARKLAGRQKWKGVGQ